MAKKRRGIRAGFAGALALLGCAALPVTPALAGQWLAGDLHVHTTYSHDSFGGPDDDNTGFEEGYTLGHPVSSQFAVAATRGLDYMAITDHNDVRSQGEFNDPLVAGSGVIPVPGHENSLDGHAQMLGATEVFESGGSLAEVQAAADRLRAAPFNGAFQINHPAEGATGDELDWKLGHQVVPDTVEVWNISRLYQPPLPSASNNDDAVRFWEGFLDRGERVAATGGSDNHYLATTPIQGAGQPTTWVYAEEASAAGVLQGLRRGHTFISHQPPNLGGPKIFIEADEDGDGEFEAMAGDAVTDTAALRVRVSGASAAMLRIVGTGGEEIGDPVPVTGPDFEHSFEVPDGTTWARAEIFLPDGAPERAQICDEQFGDQTTYCRNALGVLAMTSAIFLRPPEPPTPPDPPDPPAPPAPADPGNPAPAGEPEIQPEPSTGPVTSPVLPAPPIAACMRGTRADDRFTGTAGDDCLAGGRGDDRLNGGDGDDRVIGGPGDDRISGGPGADSIDCGPGDDVARADANDRIRGCESVKRP